MLRNFIAGMGRDDWNSVIAALYIAQLFGLVEAAQDFKPYGRARIESQVLSRLIYLITEMWANSPALGEPAKKSYPYQLGRMFRGIEKTTDFCLSALYLAYDGKKLLKSEAAIAEQSLGIIKKRIVRFKKRFKIS